MEKAELLKFAKIAEKTYLEPSEANFDELGYTIVKYFDRKGAEGYLLENDVERVLTFRGTQINQPSDVLADIKAGQDQFELYGRVHHGFKHEINKLWNQIVDELDQSSKPLYITGHSLGAAMATIAASRYADKTTALITFGSPRVGNKTFVKNLSVPHWRVVNNNDDVPKVPLWIMGYRHHGTCVYLNYYGNIRNLTSWQRMKDMMRSRIRSIIKRQLFKGIYDHMMAQYITKLSK